MPPETTAIDQEVRTHLTRLLDGSISLREFESWMVPVLFDMDQDQSAGDAAERLIARISLRLSEYRNHDWSRDELWSLLAPLTSPDWTPDDDDRIIELLDAQDAGSSDSPGRIILSAPGVGQDGVRTINSLSVITPVSH